MDRDVVRRAERMDDFGNMRGETSEARGKTVNVKEVRRQVKEKSERRVVGM